VGRNLVLKASTGGPETKTVLKLLLILRWPMRLVDLDIPECSHLSNTFAINLKQTHGQVTMFIAFGTSPIWRAEAAIVR